MIPPTSPLNVATMAQQMASKAEGADAKTFQKIAMVSMATIAGASVLKLLMDLSRHPSHRDDRGRGGWDR